VGVGVGVGLGVGTGAGLGVGVGIGAAGGPVVQLAVSTATSIRIMATTESFFILYLLYFSWIALL